MYEAISIAASGIHAQIKRQDVTSDNISNINTAGFKASRVDFKDALYRAGFGPAPAYTPEEDQQKGYGVYVGQVSKNIHSTSYQDTGNILDLAVSGNAYFSVRSLTGETLYTKAGNFYISVEDQNKIVNSEGLSILNANGEEMFIPEDAVGVGVNNIGEITYTNANGDVIGTDAFGVFGFDNRLGLEAVGETNYRTTVQSGEARAPENYTVQQGVLEMSNTDLSKEMTNMIRSQRMLQLASRALKTADDMEGIANSMKK